MPNVRKLGLLDANDGYLRQKWGEVGLMEFEFADDTGSDYETYDAVAGRDRAAGGERRPTSGCVVGSCVSCGCRRRSVEAMSPKIKAAHIRAIRKICLELPEVEEKSFGGHTAPAFRVRDKIFVMTSEDGTTMTMKAPKGVQGILIKSDPERFFFPKYVGPKGWVGVRLDLQAEPDWDEVGEMMIESYCLTAPKTLVKLVTDRIS